LDDLRAIDWNALENEGLKTRGANAKVTEPSPMKASLLAIVLGTLAISAIPASAQVSPPGQKTYCLQKGTTGTPECAYDTLAQCKQAMSGPTDSCNMRAPQTQGRGGATNPPATPPKR
jgi:hypothetical protein